MGRTPSSPETQLNASLDRFTPEIAAQARGARAALRKLLPGALELVYDNYNALVIAYGPSEKASHAILSIALYPRWVTLFFLRGATLPDPAARLVGSGKQVRSVVLHDGAKTLAEPAVRALIAAAVEQAPVALDRKQPHRLVIRAVSPKQRARRPPATSGPGRSRSRRTARA